MKKEDFKTHSFLLTGAFRSFADIFIYVLALY